MIDFNLPEEEINDAELYASLNIKAKRGALPKTHCKNGHEFTPENTITRKNGQRRCKICTYSLNKEYAKENEQRRKEYYAEYRKRPDVIDRRKAYRKDPANKERELERERALREQRIKIKRSVEWRLSPIRPIEDLLSTTFKSKREAMKALVDSVIAVVAEPPAPQEGK